MKVCPTCHRQFDDDAMVFCPDDGRLLIDEAMSEQDAGILDDDDDDPISLATIEDSSAAINAMIAERRAAGEEPDDDGGLIAVGTPVVGFQELLENHPDLADNLDNTSTGDDDDDDRLVDPSGIELGAQTIADEMLMANNPETVEAPIDDEGLIDDGALTIADEGPPIDESEAAVETDDMMATLVDPEAVAEAEAQSPTNQLRAKLAELGKGGAGGQTGPKLGFGSAAKPKMPGAKPLIDAERASAERAKVATRPGLPTVGSLAKKPAPSLHSLAKNDATPPKPPPAPPDSKPAATAVPPAPPAPSKAAVSLPLTTLQPDASDDETPFDFGDDLEEESISSTSPPATPPVSAKPPPPPASAAPPTKAPVPPAPAPAPPKAPASAAPSPPPVPAGAAPSPSPPPPVPPATASAAPSAAPVSAAPPTSTGSASASPPAAPLFAPAPLPSAVPAVAAEASPAANPSAETAAAVGATVDSTPEQSLGNAIAVTARPAQPQDESGELLASNFQRLLGRARRLLSSVPRLLPSVPRLLSSVPRLLSSVPRQYLVYGVSGFIGLVLLISLIVALVSDDEPASDDLEGKNARVFKHAERDAGPEPPKKAPPVIATPDLDHAPIEAPSPPDEAVDKAGTAKTEPRPDVVTQKKVAPAVRAKKRIRRPSRKRSKLQSKAHPKRKRRATRRPKPRRVKRRKVGTEGTVDPFQ